MLTRRRVGATNLGSVPHGHGRSVALVRVIRPQQGAITLLYPSRCRWYRSKPSACSLSLSMSTSHKKEKQHKDGPSLGRAGAFLHLFPELICSHSPAAGILRFLPFSRFPCLPTTCVSPRPLPSDLILQSRPAPPLPPTSSLLPWRICTGSPQHSALESRGIPENVLEKRGAGIGGERSEG
eukprot:123916-Hanusia_phi.AAC.1